MADVVETIDVYRLEQGRREEIPGADAGFAYRRTALPGASVIVAAAVRLRSGDPAAIRASMEEARDWRRRTQPLAEPNCGSVFKNPPGGHAARLIDEAGLKGFTVGGAHVSTKHANFVIAGPGARAADVVALIDAVRARVAAMFGVELEPEVHLVGRFADA
jgi:UDP-N-acetylmuramate dehydrogenase